MLIHRSQLHAVAATCERTHGYRTDAVAIAPDGSCLATNGTYAIKIMPPADMAKPEDAPLKMVGALDASGPGNTLIAAADVKRVIAALKGRQTISVLECASVSPSNGKVGSITTTDLQNAMTLQAIDPADASFPDVSRIIPATSNIQLAIGLDAVLLRDICDAAIKHAKDTDRHVSAVPMLFRFTNPMSAVRIERDEFLAVLMPMRT